MDADGHDYIVAPGARDAGGTITLDTIRASGAGYVEIVDCRLGDLGKMLGSADVHPGANTDVKVQVGMPPLGDVMAFL